MDNKVDESSTLTSAEIINLMFTNTKDISALKQYSDSLQLHTLVFSWVLSSINQNFITYTDSRTFPFAKGSSNIFSDIMKKTKMTMCSSIPLIRKFSTMKTFASKIFDAKYFYWSQNFESS